MISTDGPSPDRRALVMLYTLGLLEELRLRGMIEGGFDLSDKGFDAYIELRESDFEPTDEELDSMTKFLCLAAGRVDLQVESPPN